MEKIGEKIIEKIKNKRKILLWTASVVVIACVAGGVWYKSDDIKLFFKEKFPSKQAEQTLSSSDIVSMFSEKADKGTVAYLQSQISDVQTILNKLLVTESNSPNLSAVEQNVNDLRELIISSVNGKADVQSLVGIINRVDKLESEIDRLAHMNNQGSVLLAAAMLVKESALDGRDFSFEAMMLDELNANNPKISDAINEVKNLAQKRIYNNAELSEQFAEIHHEFVAKNQKDEPKNWKERIVLKIREFISVKKAEKTPEEKQIAFLNTLKNLADNQQFSQVVALINGDENPELKSSPSVQKWFENVENKKNFDAAISKISAYSLVLIKLNNVIVKE